MRNSREWLVVAVVAAVQFVSILDLMMVVPLGPDFARALGVPLSNVALVTGSYTAAAAVAGFFGSMLLDRFDRRSALAVALFGLALGTASGGLASGLATLMAARLLAGLFGGPAASLSFSIIADVVPAERRGRAMGAAMASFSLASVVGVPVGLELSRHLGWRAPFLAVGALGILVSAISALLLPSLKGHLTSAREQLSFAQLLQKPLVPLASLLTAAATVSGFVLIPNIAGYVQFNLGYPRASLSLLYMIGGATTFVASWASGALLDRWGAFSVGTAGAALLALITALGFVHYWPALTVEGLIALFMIGTTVRNVAFSTLTTRVPGAPERARFLSLQSCIQHLSSAVGSFISARLLSTAPGGALQGMPAVALFSIGLGAIVPYCLWQLESSLRARPRGPIGAQTDAAV